MGTLSDLRIMHLLRPFRHSVAIARPFARSARRTVAIRELGAVRELLTQSRDRGPSEVSTIRIRIEDAGFTDEEAAIPFKRTSFSQRVSHLLTIYILASVDHTDYSRIFQRCGQRAW